MNTHYWIVTSHKFVEHQKPGFAYSERDRLAEKHPEKTFEVRRCVREDEALPSEEAHEIPPRPPFPGVEGAPAENPHDMSHMVQIDSLISDLQTIRQRFGNTCVYLRRGGASWGAVALNRRDADEKHGVFDLQEQHDRDMAERLGQISRLIADRDETRATLAAERKRADEAEALAVARGEEIVRQTKIARLADLILARDSERVWEVTYEDGRIEYAALNPGAGPSARGVIVSSKSIPKITVLAETAMREALDAQLAEYIAETPPGSRDFVAGYLREFIKRATAKIPTNAPNTEWHLIEKLRADEGSTVEIACDNPDFNDRPNSLISVCGFWTEWQERKFTGDTVHACLVAAVAAMEQAKVEQANDAG